MADIYRKNADSEHAADYGYGTNRPVQADISSSNAPNKPSRSGLATGALALLGLLLKFKGLALTFASTFVSAVLWAQYFGWWAFGIGFVLLILIHETGHLVVARALRLPVGLPVLIPFLGAFVTMNQRPKTVAEEAQMAVGGPVLGTIASGACYLGYLAAPTTYWGSLLGGLAYFGFLINLFNLVPVTPLDGGRVMSVVSKWFNVAGLAIAAGLLVLTGFRNPVLILLVIVGAFSTWQRFRSTALSPEYYQVPASTKWMVGGLYLGLLLTLALGIEYTHSLLPARVG
ncbi:MAG: site-2 protease family protein [Chloroflexi bacterium]|nr:MAG: site-2 protease family protein [Chloroflexota bacterium]